MSPAQPTYRLAVALTATLTTALNMGACDDTESSGDAEGSDAPTEAGGNTENSNSVGDDTAGDDTAGDDTAGDDTAGAEACGTPPSCEDPMALALGFNSGVSEGSVSNEAVESGWRSTVDARAGGIANAASNAWIYARFTADGLEKVDIDDFESLDSSSWDIAAKRYWVRTNGGVAGPSCVGVSRHQEPFGSLDAEGAQALEITEEAFYDDQCVLQESASGLPQDPLFALDGWWTYPGCVATSLQPFIVTLADTRRIELVLETYYGDGQDSCNDSGTPGQDSGLQSWRWRELP